MNKAEIRRNPDMLYPCMEIPDVTAEPAEGTFYKTLAPDTYDVEERAKLALHSILAIADPTANYEPFFSIVMHSIPMMMQHTYDTAVCWGKLREALPLLRAVTGSDELMEVEQRWKELLIQQTGPDGLFYHQQLHPVRGTQRRGDEKDLQTAYARAGLGGARKRGLPRGRRAC